MPIARHVLVPEGVSRCYHCISRCVRRAFLCGDGMSHRKDWIKSRLLDLTEIFALEVGGFALMDNHLHLLVRTQPQWVDDWSDEAVVRRWLKLYPRVGEVVRDSTGATSEREIVRHLVVDSGRVKVWRRRLASLSWFMKCLKEPIARRANREDRVTGHFWEGRFKVQALLDEAAVLACLVYIDLNPIRAGMAATLEQSDHTSVQDRIHVRQAHHKCVGERQRAPRRAADLCPRLRGRRPKHAEDGIWLIPIEHASGRGGRSPRSGLVGDVTLDEYLQIVDTTGRRARFGKRGEVPAHLTPILDRLEIDGERWMESMLGHGRRVGTAIGSAASLANEAARRGARWIVGACCVHRDRLSS